MIQKFSDIVFNDETIKLAIKADNVDFQRACNSPKYLVIDWRDVKPADIDLSKMDLYNLDEYSWDTKKINNVEVLGHFIKLTDKKDPELLWIKIVDDNRYISHELYCKNTFEENLNVLVKMTNFNLPL